MSYKIICNNNLALYGSLPRVSTSPRSGVSTSPTAAQIYTDGHTQQME